MAVGKDSETSRHAHTPCEDTATGGQSSRKPVEQHVNSGTDPVNDCTTASDYMAYIANVSSSVHQEEQAKSDSHHDTHNNAVTETQFQVNSSHRASVALVILLLVNWFATV